MSWDPKLNLKNVIWGSFVQNFERANDSKYAGGKRFGFGLLGALQVIPVLGQVLSAIQLKSEQFYKAKKQADMPSNLQKQSEVVENQSFKILAKEHSAPPHELLQITPNTTNSARRKSPPLNSILSTPLQSQPTRN